jgi:myo-inositol 2-dehydrogenase / D-chiro-inositol 1-dehydrogenase
MKKTTVRLGFFGTGNHATDSLYPCIPQIADAYIAAVYSRTREHAERTARRFGIPAAFDSAERLLDKESIDAAIIVGPPQMHADAAQRCLERGVPVFIEKPPAVDTDTTKQLVDLAETNGTFGMVGFNKRFSLGYRMAKHLVSGKKFGNVTFIDIKFSNGAWPTFWDIDHRPTTFLIGQAIHMFDLLRFFSGEIDSLYALYSERSVDRFGYAVQCRMQNGALVTMNMTSYESWNTFNELVSVTGEGNYITVENGLHLKYHPEKNWIDLPGSEIYNLYQGWDVSGPMPRTSNFSHEHLGYLGELRAFVDAIQIGSEPAPDLTDGLRAMEACDAVLGSLDAGGPVSMPSAG